MTTKDIDESDIHKPKLSAKFLESISIDYYDNVFSGNEINCHASTLHRSAYLHNAPVLHRFDEGTGC
jgi:hypothetical protein